MSDSDINSDALRARVDSAARESGYGALTSALSYNYWGINKFSNRSAFLPTNKDVMGYTFFTRPILNLSYDNLLRNEKLNPLALNKPDSIPGAIRSMFDATGTINRNEYSQLFDNSQAFLPILSNTLDTLSGFPDIVVDTFTAAPGQRKETWMMVDGQVEFNEAYQVTGNFINVLGDPLTMILDLLQVYSSSVYLGELVPYWDSIVNNFIDYTFRFYRIILDSTGTYCTKIGAPYAAIALTNPIGNAFDYSSTKDNPLVKANNQISCMFGCVGFRHNCISLVLDFNATVVLFNPMMADNQRATYYRKLTPSEYQSFNFIGYPRIDPATYEFQWWVDIRAQ